MLTTDRDVDAAIADNYEEAMRLQAALFEQRPGSRRLPRRATPRCWPGSSAGIISAYQALDPAVMSDDRAGERLPLADLHALVERAFTP